MYVQHFFQTFFEHIVLPRSDLSGKTKMSRRKELRQGCFSICLQTLDRGANCATWGFSRLQTPTNNLSPITIRLYSLIRPLFVERDSNNLQELETLQLCFTYNFTQFLTRSRGDVIKELEKIEENYGSICHYDITSWFHQGSLMPGVIDIIIFQFSSFLVWN